MRCSPASTSDRIRAPASSGSSATGRRTATRRSHGCPIGSFTSELNKRNRGLDERAAGLLATIRDWITTQFRLLGQPHPRDLAHRMLSSIQGSALLTNTFRDPTILAREMRYLESWIKACPPPTDGQAATLRAVQ